MNSVNKPVYPLIPPQEMIQFMLKYSFFHKQVTQIPDSIIVSQKIDFDVMPEAFNIEIERNDCLRLVFFKQNGKIMQYFRDPYRIGGVPVYNFKSDEEREKVLTADAQKPIKMLKGEIFRLKYFTTYDGRYGVYINIHHLVMDNAAVFAFFNDLFAVYDHLKNGKPMPKPLGSYEDRIKRELAYVEDKSNLEKEKAAYTEYITRNGEPLYLGVEGPKLLEAERKKKKDPSINAPSLFDPIHDKAELTKTTFSPELSEKFFSFCENNNVSPECLVQLALRMHLSKSTTVILIRILFAFAQGVVHSSKSVRAERLPLRCRGEFILKRTIPLCQRSTKWLTLRYGRSDTWTILILSIVTSSVSCSIIPPLPDRQL